MGVPLEAGDDVTKTDDGEWLNVTPAADEVSIYPLVRRLDFRRSPDELELSPQIAGVSLPADYAVSVRFAGESAQSADAGSLTLTSSDASGASLSVPATEAQAAPGGVVVLEGNIRDHVE